VARLESRTGEVRRVEQAGVSDAEEAGSHGYQRV
jgi:hypothetical protein